MEDEKEIKNAITDLMESLDSIREKIDQLEILVDKLFKLREISKTVVLQERNWTVTRFLMSDGREYITFDGPRGSLWLSPDLAEHSLKWYEAGAVPKYVRIKVKDLVDAWKGKYLRKEA